MNNMKMEIWGREFDIRIVIQNYSGEELLLSQMQAISKLTEVAELKNQSKENVDCVDPSEEYMSFIDESKGVVEKYILEHQPESGELQTVDNIFKYVIPKTITIARSEQREIALLCNFKFDMEHGLAIVFENEHFKMIGEQDIAL